MSAAHSDIAPTRLWSMRRRLTGSLLATVGLVLVLLFVVIDRWVDREIYERLDFTLLQRAKALSHAFERRTPAQLEHMVQDFDPGGHTEFFTVFGRQGQVVLLSANSRGSPLPSGDSSEGTPRFFDVSLPDGHAGRALATRLPDHEDGTDSQLLVIATERASWDQAERHIHFALLGAVFAALALVVGIGLLVMNHVFSVLRGASVEVERLDADAPLQPIGDEFPRELQPFAKAFNTGIERLYDAIQRERRFSRDVAHELRTPLAEIRASAELALSNEPSAALKSSLANTIEASKRMQRSIDTLLLLARLESGQEKPSLDPFDLGQMLNQMIEALAGVAGRRDIRVDTETPASAWVSSDLGIVERISSNLLRNAIDYAPKGDRVGCRLQQDEAGWWLEVSNVAPSLQAEDLRQFGQRFWRKQSEGGTVEHTGLGLALSFGLAKVLDIPLHFSLDGRRLTARFGPLPAI